MRKERSERSKTMEKTTPLQPTGQMNLQSLEDIDFSAAEESMAEDSTMELITPGAGPSRSKKSNNKKKKKKRKNKR